MKSHEIQVGRKYRARVRGKMRTVQVLRGRVRITAGEDTADGLPGQLLIMPRIRHTLTAVEDIVVLLTVVKRSTPIAPDGAGGNPSASYWRQARRKPWPVNASSP